MSVPENLKPLEAVVLVKEAAEDAATGASNLNPDVVLDTAAVGPADTVPKLKPPPVTVVRADVQAIAGNAKLDEPEVVEPLEPT